MKLELDDAARAEILRIAQWYEAEEVGLGDEFITAVFDDGRIISEAPRAWPAWPDIRQHQPLVHRFVMSRFPYLIGFHVFDDRVLILVVTHAKRRPAHWP